MKATTIEAVYEDGVFKPLQKICAREHEKFKITLLSLTGDYSDDHLRMAYEGGSFDFLKSIKEDIYSLNEGEIV